MRNPLHKRLSRELFGEIGKYTAIFLFMLGTIGFVSGFLVASGSVEKTYKESFEKYKIEDGHFVLDGRAEAGLIERMEKEDITLYEDFYLELDADTDLDGNRDSTLRIFGGRKEVNGTCLLSGVMPETEYEIAIDRMYAVNNGIEIGDTICIRNSDSDFLVTGLIALADYSALFQDNNDMIFDATMFGVAVVTDETFTKFGTDHLFYSYAWKYDEKPVDDTEEKEASEKLAKSIVGESAQEGLRMLDFIPGFMNRAIHFVGDDIGKDRPMMTILLYILIVIMAFLFAVTIHHTVARESTVIGTLRASGYTKAEMFRHYLAVPMFVTLLAALLGNAAGYTLFEDIARNMYMESYSLLAYESVWNADAFVKTTLIPMIIMLIVTSVSLWRNLSFTPLQFIRRDIVKRKRTRAVRLPDFRFFTRFRLRILLQNMPGYFILFAGIVFANLLLVFGMAMPPMLKDYGRDAVNYMPANYQYVINGDGDVPETIAEKYGVTSLRMQDDYFGEESINVYGLVQNSDYIDVKLPESGVIITSDMAEKYRLEEGDIINMKEPYGDTLYAFEVKGILYYPTSLSVYMTRENFNGLFGQEEDYYNGYFTNEKLEDTYLDENQIVNCVTQEDVTKLSRQMDISMGEMMDMVNVFAIILFALLIYLLTKLILEKNTTSISMVKILGYGNGEIGRLYLVSSVWVVVISSVLALSINTWFFRDVILRPLIKGFGGWFHVDISKELYLDMFLMMIGTYLLVALLQFFKIRKIPMDEALKNVE